MAERLFHRQLVAGSNPAVGIIGEQGLVSWERRRLACNKEVFRVPLARVFGIQLVLEAPSPRLASLY